MTFIDPSFSVAGSEQLTFDNRHLILKVKSPSFTTHDSYRVPFQPKLMGHHDTPNKTAVLVFPLIPQYFHNFFEIFTKILILKELQQDFKLVLIHPETKENGVFPSLIRGHAEATCNAAHIKDFTDLVGVEIICLNPDEFLKSKFGHVFLSYMTPGYGGSDAKQELGGSIFELYHFLKVPFSDILVKDISLIRNLFPTQTPTPNNKIFISRKKAWDRKYEHQGELELLMNRAGYRSVLLEDLSLIEQINVVQTASHIVCEYGSALVNCGLLGAETKVFSINHTRGYYVDPYHAIFRHYGVNHTGISVAGQEDPLNAVISSLRASQDFYGF